MNSSNIVKDGPAVGTEMVTRKHNKLENGDKHMPIVEIPQYQVVSDRFANLSLLTFLKNLVFYCKI